MTSSKSNNKRTSVKVKRLVAPWAAAAPHFGHASPPSPVKSGRFQFIRTTLTPLTVIACSTRDLLRGKETIYPYRTNSTIPTARTTVHSGTSTMNRVYLVLCQKSIMPSQQPSPPPRRGHPQQRALGNAADSLAL